MRNSSRVVVFRKTGIDDLLSKFLVYFDASQNVDMATSTSISQWVDKVSGLVASQATSSAQPLINTIAGNIYVNVNSSSKFLTINIPTPLNINTSQAYFCFSNAVFSCTVDISNAVSSLEIGRALFLLNSLIIFNGFPTPEENLRIIEFLKTKLAYNSQSLNSLIRSDLSSLVIGKRITNIFSNSFFINITDFQSTWLGCTGLTSFPLLDTSNGTNFQDAWRGCTGLTSFSLLNTSNGTNFRGAWRGCTGLTSFSLLNTSNGTIFQDAWHGCSGLTSFPLLNTSSGTSFLRSWYSCAGLTSFPLLDTSNGTNFQGAWQGCTGLTSFPANFFDNWVGIPVLGCFLDTWSITNSKLTTQSVENILVSIAFSARNAPAGATGTQADITITYDTNTGSLSTATTNAITTLKSRGWTPRVNGTYV